METILSESEKGSRKAEGWAPGGRVRPVLLDMSSVRLGCLDEYGLMVLFGNNHSLCLTEGLPNNPANIMDASGKILYPAYFMTDLRVPESLPLETFGLWDTIRIGTCVKRFGSTLLESTYAAGAADEEREGLITMTANSLFILDPGKYRSRARQVSAPAKGAIRELLPIAAPPAAIREAALVRARGFGKVAPRPGGADAFEYLLEQGRDVDAGHPLLFAKIPSIMEIAEKRYLREAARGRLPEEALQATRLSSRKTFYYGNAFAGRTLTLHSRAMILELADAPLAGARGRQATHSIEFETELYDAGELLAISHSRKRLEFGIQEQSLIQDAKRVLRAEAGKAGERP